MSKFAQGNKAWGRCQRCGDRHYLKDLVSDGYVKGLMVCSTCYCPYPEQWKPINLDDAMALKRPAPDTDDDSPGQTGNLSTALFPGQRYFGGT